MRCFRPFRVSSFRSVPFSPLVRQLHTSIPKRSHVWQNKELVSLVKDVKSMGPIFPAKSENFTFVKGPIEFYNELKASISNAKERIVFSSLYLGTSWHGDELVSTMIDACARNPNLKITILLDHLRGTRGKHNSVTLLLPLLRRFPDRVNLYLYHTHRLKGLMKKFVPARVNEVIGVQHCKIYAVDDAVMCSGYFHSKVLLFRANLSETYFENRQDRYVWIRDNPQLLNFLVNIVETINTFSFKVDAEGQTTPVGPNPLTNTKEFVAFVHRQLSGLLETQTTPWEMNEADTWVIPTLQLGGCDVRHDERVVSRFLDLTQQEGARWFLTSPYMNLTPRYRQQLLQEKSFFDIITAAPEANSFFTAKDISRQIPVAYSYVEEQLFREISARGLQDRMRLWEYCRPNWTFHAKGLWYSPPGATGGPSATLLGSGNLGLRSAERDTEAQLLVVTENLSLQKKLEEERQQVWEGAVPVSFETFQAEHRRPSLLTRMALPLLKDFL